MSPREVIEKFQLEPLPQEGGFFRRTYEQKVKLPARSVGIEATGERRLCTAIYFLVTPDEFSALHRVKSDELFHFYCGDAVEMVQLDLAGMLTRFSLGAGIDRGETPQVLVPANSWQGLRLREGGRWALLGTTVSPGFEYEDFEIGERERLRREYPRHAETIGLYTRP